MAKTMSDISEAMRDIDFCTLSTIAANGAIASRPMSNNREVDYTGDSWFFTTDDTVMVRDIAANPQVACSYQGGAGLMGVAGKPGMFIHVEARGMLIRDKAQFADHWDKSLDRWFEQGADTPGLVLIRASAARIHYWDGEEEGEVAVPQEALQ
jgi:general stress protein 26